MKSVGGKLLMVPLLAGGLLAAPKSAQAGCTEAYFVCLNEAVQDPSWLARQLKEVECGLGYAGCLARYIKE